MYRKALDLIIIAVSTIIAMVLALAGVDFVAGRVLFGLPLLMLWPGYALTAAIFSNRTIALAERLLISIGLSIGIAAMSGLSLNVTSGGLQPGSWALLLGTVTLVACGVALFRRRNSAEFSPVQLKLNLNLKQGAMLGLAGLLLVGAVMVARNGAEQTSAAFTQLWLLPPTATSQNTVRVGLNNQEGSTVSYKLQVEQDNKVVNEWPSLELKAGQSWEVSTEIPAPGTKTVQAILYRLDQPNTVYRKVTLWQGK